MKKLLSGKIATMILFCVLSFMAGAVNGFVGTGGGIVLVFTLGFLTNSDKKDIFATSLCATIPISCIALFNYIKAGNVDFGLVKEMWLPVLLGGLLGAVLVDKLKLPWLNGIFAILVIYSGTCMILG